MITLKEALDNKSKINVNLKLEYQKALNDEDFLNLRKSICLDDNILSKYTFRMKDCVKEKNNCKQCKDIMMCPNEVKGYTLSPIVDEKNISFSYVACDYMNKELEGTSHQKNIRIYDEPISLKNAKIKDIYLDDKSRIDTIKYISDYIRHYNNNRMKGLYLTGNFGCGKTYLISALFNELAKQNVNSAIIYFPEFLRTLKASFNITDGESFSYSEKFEYIKRVELLLIDDIGAENLTTWARDEILGTILQYRMQENLPTFFTSNLTLDELEIHMSISSGKVDKVKARRIIERIKYLTTEIKMVGNDRRK